jgi:protein-S-isoprenylcysteine O-methyltransferase Ste14
LILVIMAVAALGRRAILPLPSDRLETRRIYGIIRRPMGLGWMIAGLGATLQAGGTAAWVCYAIWSVLVNVFFELEEWELRTRIPAARQYLKQTPRYLPWQMLRIKMATRKE